MPILLLIVVLFGIGFIIGIIYLIIGACLSKVVKPSSTSIDPVEEAKKEQAEHDRRLAQYQAEMTVEAMKSDTGQVDPVTEWIIRKKNNL